MLLILALLPSPAQASPAQEADADRAMADVRWLVEEIGPRPAGSDEEAAAAEGVARRLAQAGWEPRREGCSRCVLACRGAGERLFLAHIDSVPEAPGAVDNAAGVAALLELARTTQSQDLCLGFPTAEETGLRGSEGMARAWPAPLPALVVALDLTGQGRLSVTGLGPAWGTDDLRWLLRTADVDSPLAYRVVSHALPHMERSDHRPFADRGARSMQLLGRGDGGVYARYHQPTDRGVDRQAEVELLGALGALATAPLPVGRPDAAATVGRIVVPAWLTWTVLGLGLLSGAHDLLRPCEGRPILGALKGLAQSLWRCLAATTVAALVLAGATLAGLLAPTEAETTARAVMGVGTTGWWAGAAPGLLLGWAAWALVRKRLGGRGSGPLAASVLAGLTLWVDPLLALPFGLAALLTRVHPLLGALPALYLLWPDKLRELAFHDLLTPWAWGALWLLAWPAFGARRRSAQGGLEQR